MFVNNNTEAANVFGAGNFRAINIDPGQKLRIIGDEAEITTLSGLITSNGMAEALEKTSLTLKDKGTWESVYNNFVLYPKATSQIAKQFYLLLHTLETLLVRVHSLLLMVFYL